MNKVDFVNLVKFHASVMLKGLIRTLHGTFTAGLIAVAIYGFVIISTEAGYEAVCDFIASCATLLVALCNLHMMGRKKRSAKK